jgi:putative colanic acid biosynthesis UDP-glucose lipid carrier transferase
VKRGTWAQDDVVAALRRGLDGLIILATHWLACMAYREKWNVSLAWATALAILVFLIAAEANGLYRMLRIHRWSELRALLLSWMMAPAVLVLLAFSIKTSAHYSRVVSFGWFFLAPMGLVVGRLSARLVLARVRRGGWKIQRVALAGSGPNVHDICTELTADPWQGVEIVGVFDDRVDPKRRVANDTYPAVGNFSALARACRNGEVDVVYLNLPLAAQRRTAYLLRTLADTTATVFLVADFFTYDLMCARWSVLGRYPIVSVYDSPFRGRSGLLKRIEDLAFGLGICALIALPMLAIALAVKLTSKGPVFFRQRRYGLNGKEIRVLKFRSMTVCEDGPKIAQATRNDKRVTRLGKFLRKSSLDELPQFLQVLTGEMSIVGPRPHAVAHNEEYRTLIRNYMLRHKVKPGITGWAQVNGWRGETPDVAMMEKRVQHDLEYIKSWTLYLDVKIIFMTVFGKKKSQNAF